jgi:uncharacterized membrane protein
MDDFDSWLIAIHIFAAAIWVGGSFYAQMLAIRTKRTAPPAELASFAQNTEFLGTRIFLPTSLILVIAGITLVSRDIFTLEGWVVFGLVVWALSFLSGAFFLGPQSGKFGKELEERGPQPEVMARLDRLFLVSRVELTLLILVVFDMALKPGT